MPERPEGESEPGDPTPILFAIEELRLDIGSRDAGVPAPVGFNLDRSCGCACVPPAGATCGEGAVDNRGGELLTQGIAAAAFDSEKINLNIRRGGFSLIIGVGAWNRTESDRAVTVSVWISSGLAKLDAGPSAPSFTGDDVWNIEPDSVSALPGTNCATSGVCISNYRDESAYVRDGRLVANFARLPVAFVTAEGRFAALLTGGVLMARVTPDATAGGYRISGEFGGRIPTDDFLSSVATFKIPNVTGDQPLCQSALFSALATAVCGAADVARDPLATGAPCDSLSSATAFAGVVAKLGTVAREPATPAACPASRYGCE